MHPVALSSLVHTLSNLRCMFFIRELTEWSRKTLELGHRRGEYFNPAIPLQSSVQTFDRIIDDPRPIDLDLQRVYVGSDPKTSPFLWRETLRAFQITHERRPECHFLLACCPTHHGVHISSRETADIFLDEEVVSWTSLSSADTEKYNPLLYPDRGAPDIPPDAVLPAVGCWVLPATIFGDIPEGKWEEMEWERNMVVDISKERPRLIVFDI